MLPYLVNVLLKYISCIVQFVVIRVFCNVVNFNECICYCVNILLCYFMLGTLYKSYSEI